ncbi:hypothetical protein CF319_g4367 [Tilletia indica]|nr:hypothetical protein CF319_g4367 [Tilletia indica]
MSNPLLAIFSGIFSVLRFLVSSLTGIFASSSYSSAHMTAHLHSSRILIYRGPDTYVPITILSDASDIDTDKLKVTLIQKGYRAGLFGWGIARYLGDVSERGIDVTPDNTKKWDGSDSTAPDIDTVSTASSSSTKTGGDEAEHRSTLTTPNLTQRQRSKIHTELENLIPDIPHKHRLATFLVRIPVRSGDGYFRFKIRTAKNTVYSPTMRILSVSLSSASIKGASILPPTIVPELLIRAVGLAVTTFLYGLFPIAALLEKVLPRKWSRKLLGWLYRRLGMEQRQQQFMDKHGQKVLDARKKTMEAVPFASLGVRTHYEIEKDEKAGRGGVMYLHA